MHLSRRHRKFLSGPLVGAIVAVVCAPVNSNAYVVKPGDCLSKIIKSVNAGPLFGANGTLQRILKLNPQIQNPNLIFPGLVIDIELPANEPQQSASEPTARDVSSIPAESGQNSTEPPSPEIQSVQPTASRGVETVASVTTPEIKWGALEVEVGTKFVRIDGRDNAGAEATFLTDLSPTFSAAWQQNFSDTWQTRLQVQYDLLKFQKPTPKTLSDEKIGIGSFDVQLRKSFGISRHYLEGSVGIGSEPFAQAVDAQMLSFELVPLAHAHLAGAFLLTDHPKFAAFLKLGVGGLSSGGAASFRVNPTVFYFSEAQLSQTLKTVNLRGSLFYRGQNQNSPELGSQKRSDIGLRFAVEWGLN